MLQAATCFLLQRTIAKSLHSYETEDNIEYQLRSASSTAGTVQRCKLEPSKAPGELLRAITRTSKEPQVPQGARLELLSTVKQPKGLTYHRPANLDASVLEAERLPDQAANEFKHSAGGEALFRPRLRYAKAWPNSKSV